MNRVHWGKIGINHYARRLIIRRAGGADHYPIGVLCADLDDMLKRETQPVLSLEERRDLEKVFFPTP